jgi:GT2 family glycosyltransferase
MNDRSCPEMSVVLITPDRYDTVRKTISYLREQTVKHRLEIVIVAPSADRLNLEEPELKEFFTFSVVEVGEVTSIGAANCAGVQRANAPIVALGEDHAYPDPDWAEILIEAHQESWAAVGPKYVMAIRTALRVGLISFLTTVHGLSPPQPKRSTTCRDTTAAISARFF